MIKNWQIVHTSPYSPWFNPNERVFSIVKNHFRKNRSIKKAFEFLDSKKIDNILMSAYKEVAIAKKARLSQGCC